MVFKDGQVTSFNTNICTECSIADLHKWSIFDQKSKILPYWQHYFYLPYESIYINAD